MLYSPINYPGNKSRISDKIVEIFPNEIDKIYDIFCGSAIVTLNSNVETIILNDIDKIVIDLLKYFKDNKPDEIIKNVDEVINKFELTNTFYEGKEKYLQVKHEGLSNYNREAFNKLKNSYNKTKNLTELFTLIIYGFNHYIRFNKKGEYNIPVGKIDFVKSLRNKIKNYCDFLNNKKVSLFNLDFRNEKLYKNATEKDLYYFDPPYLITLAPYNNFWKEKDERDLLNLLDELNGRKVKFALSNVISSNGKENILLKKWMKTYRVHPIHRRYLNSNYRKKKYYRSKGGFNNEFSKWRFL